MTVAAIDIGSNSIRLLVLSDDGTALQRETAVTGLGRGVDRSGRFREDSVAATLDVIENYADAIKAYGASRIRAAATSASRDVENGDDLMQSIEALIGVAPEIISGAVEADLSFRGATRHTAGEPPYLVVDIGGGSTEFVFGVDEPAYAVSIDIGSVRLTDRKLPDRPPTAAQLSEASAHADGLFSTIELPASPQTVIGVAGTFTSLSAISLGLERYDRDAVHGSSLSRMDIKDSITTLSGLTIEETAAIPSLDPRRAPVILAGTVIADRSLVVAGRDKVVVSEYGLLHALAEGLL